MKKKIAIMMFVLLVLVTIVLPAQSIANTFYANNDPVPVLTVVGGERFCVFEFKEARFIQYWIFYGHDLQARVYIESNGLTPNVPRKINEGSYSQSGNEITLIVDDGGNQVKCILVSPDHLQIRNTSSFKVPSLNVSEFPKSLFLMEVDDKGKIKYK